MPERVLLADHTPADRDFIALLLQQCGVRHVTGTSTGSEAVTALSSSPSPIDCVIADLKMPSGTGLQFLQVIRCNNIRNARADMCILLMSNAWDKESLNCARTLDVNGVLAKPFTREKLHAEILAARRRFRPIDIHKYRSVSLPL